VQDTLTASLGRTPSVDELASTLGVDRESVTEALADAARVVTSIDDTISDFIASPTETPEQTLLTTERSVYVRAAVDALPDNMRYIVEQVYFNERTVKDLAAELGSTHSAVSQHRAEAVRLLRDGLVAHYADGETAEETVHSRIAPSRRTAYLARLAEYAQAGVARQMPDIAQEISAAS
jgi:RNA polymerase sigma factor for flagellar operon FliA